MCGGEKFGAEADIYRSVSVTAVGLWHAKLMWPEAQCHATVTASKNQQAIASRITTTHTKMNKCCAGMFAGVIPSDPLVAAREYILALKRAANARAASVGSPCCCFIEVIELADETMMIMNLPVREGQDLNMVKHVLLGHRPGSKVSHCNVRKWVFVILHRTGLLQGVCAGQTVSASDLYGIQVAAWVALQLLKPCNLCCDCCCLLHWLAVGPAAPGPAGGCSGGLCTAGWQGCGRCSVQGTCSADLSSQP